MYISSPAILRLINIEATNERMVPLTNEFDYRWNVVKSGHFQREKYLRETTKWLITRQISINGKGADRVMDPIGLIKKANLMFEAKFIWLFVLHCLSPTAADNILTLDRVVLLAAIVSKFEIDIAIC